jgi:glutamine synthetase adenylyltransferase
MNESAEELKNTQIIPAVSEQTADVIKPQRAIENVGKKLLELSKLSDTPPELKPKQAEFEAIYEQLPAIANDLITSYKLVCSKCGLDPGETRLYMVGGRIKGKPLKASSDIDLIFTVEYVRKSPGSSMPDGGWDPMDALDYSLLMQQQIQIALKEICKVRGITNHFHIIDYGSKNSSGETKENALLIGVQS